MANVSRRIEQKKDTRRARAGSQCIDRGKPILTETVSTTLHLSEMTPFPTCLVVIDDQAPPWRRQFP
jgi:hypothetical protein